MYTENISQNTREVERSIGNTDCNSEGVTNVTKKRQKLLTDGHKIMFENN